jgi:hypothetical protein
MNITRYTPYQIDTDILPPWLLISEWAKVFGLVYHSVYNHAVGYKECPILLETYTYPGSSRLYATRDAVILYLIRVFGDQSRKCDPSIKIPPYGLQNQNMRPIRQYGYTYRSQDHKKYVVPKKVRLNEIEWDSLEGQGTEHYWQTEIVGDHTSTRVWYWLHHSGLRHIRSGRSRIIHKTDLMEYLRVDPHTGIYMGDKEEETMMRTYISKTQHDLSGFED